MSRIRGIEVKVQKEILQTRKYGLNEILKQKTEEQPSESKDDVESEFLIINFCIPFSLSKDLQVIHTHQPVEDTIRHRPPLENVMMTGLVVVVLIAI